MRKAKIAAALLAVAIVVGANRLGIFQLFAEPARMKHALLGLGVWGYLGFITAYTVLQPFGLPGTVFVVAAPLIWPWPVAFVLSMVGSILASAAGFSFARFLGRDWVEKVLPARFRKYDAQLAERAFTTVFLLRFVFWMHPLLHAFFGVSKVRSSTHLLASLAAYALPVLLISYFGERALDYVRDAPPGHWLTVGLIAVILALVTLALRRYVKRRDAGKATEGEP